jgi:Ca2+-binding EF-hand superfamily protein
MALTVPLLGCAGRPSRAPAEAPRPPEFRGGPNAILLQYDANHDGTVTREELVAGLQTEFARLDTNHGGCLDAAQISAINQQRLAVDQSTATLLQDWNQDGCVDYREFATAAYSLFDELDANRDGKVTPEEFNPRPARAPRPQPPQAGRGPRGGGP